jgi:cytochrome bd-type quinol oxidase subunit 2
MSGRTPYNPRDLTSEKDLWSVFLLSRKVRPSRFSFWVTLLVASALLITAFRFSVPTEIILRDARKWAEIGLNYAITTLGFLIAGYTIFATVADPKMMLAMMEHTDCETGLPTLKVNHIKFMKVLIDYLIWIFIYILVVLFG